MTRGSPYAGHAAQAVTQAQLAPVLAAVVGQTLGHALQPLGPGCLLVPEMRDVCIIVLFQEIGFITAIADGQSSCFVWIGGCNLAFDASVKLIYLLISTVHLFFHSVISVYTLYPSHYWADYV